MQQVVECLSRFRKGRVVTVLTPITPVTVLSALNEVGGTFKHVALMIMIGLQVKRLGIFASDQTNEIAVSFTDMKQGTAYNYIALNVLIWGVENNYFDCPGLETNESDDRMSNLAREKMSAEHSLRNCFEYHSESGRQLPADLFFFREDNETILGKDQQEERNTNDDDDGAKGDDAPVKRVSRFAA